MAKLLIAFVLALACTVVHSSPISGEETAQQSYNQHQLTQQNQDPNANSFTFDNHNKHHRDRGYGFEKAYAYSRDTAFFDFDDDKGTLNARDLVENLGKLSNKEDDLLKNTPK